MDVKKQFWQIAIVLLVGLVIVSFLGQSSADAPKDTPEPQERTATEQDSAADSDQVAEVLKQIRTFSAEEFKQAYDDIALPNITPIVSAPEITGNETADQRIQTLAEARGYQLRHVASGLLNELDSKPVQELLINSWTDLEQMAREEGISIRFRSGYRSIEDQRELFTDRLLAAGATYQGVANGSQDDIVDQVLAVTAPPGYSRHHGGYTIDVEDPGSAVFAQSAAYAWISANNFEKAKLHGFIPSYPEGLTNQGPNPEPWEFVWVSEQITYE